MLVRLTTKLAEMVNGVDLSCYHEGDVIELPDRDANMLIAERWAELIGDAVTQSHTPWRPNGRAVATDRRRRRG